MQGPWIKTRKYCFLFEELLDFSTTDAIPFSQVPNYVKQKADEKEKLEQEIKNLEWKIGMLKLEQSDSFFENKPYRMKG